ncbi:GATA123a, partial [Mycena amicta]
TSSAKVCARCGTNATSRWRRHPQTREWVCNACGLFLRPPSRLTPAERTCTNCGATVTRKWRRDKKGDQVCDACGKYERKRGTSRPAHLFRDDV